MFATASAGLRPQAALAVFYTLFVFVFVFGRIVDPIIRIRPNSANRLFGTALVLTKVDDQQLLKHTVQPGEMHQE